MKKHVKLSNKQLRSLVESVVKENEGYEATCLPDDPRVDAAIIDLVELCIEVLGDNGSLEADSFDTMHTELNNAIRDALAPYEW